MNIADRLMGTIEEMREAEREYTAVSEHLARAKAIYETRAADETERLRVEENKLTVAQVNARVQLAVESVYRTYMLLSEQSKALLETVRCKRAELSALQTLCGLEREEAAFSRMEPSA